jgi:chemotaxis protein methyltransferase CheR
MQPADFQFLAKLIHDRSGIALTPDKDYLLESRLLPIARVHGISDLAGLVARLRTAPDEAMLKEIIEAMTTNESSFFRDGKPFEQLKQHVLPMLAEKQRLIKRLRIWSAACSTGQEPYSTAMLLLEESAKMPGFAHEIVGTDLAQKVVDRAKQGMFSQFEVQRGVPITMLLKYFAQQSDSGWQLKENVRSMVQYRTLNLLESYAAMGKFDLIFCRNVLIYFDDPTKQSIIEKMAQCLHPHGLLILGSTETAVDPKGIYVPYKDCRGMYALKG